MQNAKPERPIAAVLADHTPGWMAIDGVVAVGQGERRDHAPCIRVFLRRRDPALAKRFPSQVEGYPVEVAVAGDIRALPGDSR